METDRHCFACDGTGRKYHGTEPEMRSCEVCAGKGRWTAEDIRRYHATYPEVCASSCGPTHVEPTFRDIRELLLPGEVDEALREADALRAKYKDLEIK